MMESDREALCGPKGRHQENRRAWRGGSTSSRVTLGGRQVELPRLRVRSAEGEAALASFQWAATTDPMDAHTLEANAAGVSTRRYGQTLDPLPEAMEEHGISRSAVSRRFMALSRKRMHEFLSRPLADLDIAVVFVDAKFFREHCVLIALPWIRKGPSTYRGFGKAPRRTRPWPAPCSPTWSSGGCPPSARCCSSSTGRRRCDAPSPRSTWSGPSFSAAKCTNDAMSSLICPSTNTPRSRGVCARRSRVNRPRWANGVFATWPVRSSASIPGWRPRCTSGSTRPLPSFAWI